MSHARRTLIAAGAAFATGLAGLTLAPTTAQARGGGDAPYTTKTPTSRGFGGAVTSVDPEASKIGVDVLRHGGNAVDAAVATAAALGVTEPYSSGIGGGGYFVHYDARSGKVSTLDGRETAPQSMPTRRVHRPQVADRQALQLHPGAGHQRRLRRYAGDAGHLGHRAEEVGSPAVSPRRSDPRPSWPIAASWWTRPSTCRRPRTRSAFANFPATSKLFLPDGAAPAVGSILRNPDLAATYRLIAKQGARAFYRGALADQIARTAQHPPKAADATLPVPPGYLESSDLAGYRVKQQAPTHVDYRGLDVYGMGPSSSGGSTVGEALNILERFKLQREERRRGPAPLPRGECAGVRRPRQVRRRPGVRRRAPAHAALRPVRRLAGLRRSTRTRRPPSRSPPAT